MSKTVEFYFDFASPTAYLAYTQLPAICDACEATLNYHPILLGGIFKAAENASPITVPAKGAYMLQDLARFAERYGVELNFNPYFPINTITLMRCAVGIQMTLPERLQEYIAAMYSATWVQGLNVGDEDVLKTVLGDSQFDTTAILALAQDPAVKEQLKSDTEDVVKKGAFGAPTLFVGDEMFFGQDRLDFVREALMAS